MRILIPYNAGIFLGIMGIQWLNRRNFDTIYGISWKSKIRQFRWLQKQGIPATFLSNHCYEIGYATETWIDFCRSVVSLIFRYQPHFNCIWGSCFDVNHSYQPYFGWWFPQWCLRSIAQAPPLRHPGEIPDGWSARVQTWHLAIWVHEIAIGWWTWLQ